MMPSRTYRNFKLIRQVDRKTANGFLAEIREADIWTLNPSRSYLDSQKDTQTISLRRSERQPGFTGKGWDIQETTDDQIDRFPRLKAFLAEFCREEDTALARAMVVRLKPWGEVYRHYDAGRYYVTRDRFHLVLQSTGSDMTSGDEAAVFHPGDLFWFQNRTQHQAFNHSPQWRIHVIWDVETDRYKRAGAISSPSHALG